MSRLFLFCCKLAQRGFKEVGAEQRGLDIYNIGEIRDQLRLYFESSPGGNV